MNKTIWTASISMLLMIASLPLHAQSSEEAISSDSVGISKESLYKMSDEQFLLYSDSVYWSRHEEMKLVHCQDTSKQVDLPERQQSNFSYSNSYVPNSVTVNTSKAVGQIDIQSGISPSGAKTYTIPIKGYQYDGAFCPEISLTYNSQGGNCGYGKGWSVGGLQSITRVNKSIYYDEKTDGIKMNAEDAFCLNGVRLVRTSASAYEYETEQGLIKAVATVDGSVIKYFNVYYPNGYTAVFGMTSTSTNKLEYPITSLTDTRGRNISFNYTTYNSNYFISYITYDYNSARISFTYDQSRPDYKVGYRAGLLLDSKYLLKNITCTRYSSELGVYTLTYSTDNNTPLLTQVDFSANNSSLNPLRFYYGDNSAIQGYEADHGIIMSGYDNHRKMLNAIRGRFDYYYGTDGVMIYPNMNPYYHVSNGSINRFENKYNPNLYLYFYHQLNGGFINPSLSLTLGSNYITTLVADLDGDQHESFIKISNQCVGSEDVMWFTTYWKTNLGVFQRFNRFFYGPNVYTDGRGNKSLTPKYYYTGDFNGDGKSEVLVITADNPFGGTGYSSMCYIYDLVNFSVLYSNNLLTFHKEFESTSQTLSDAENNSDKIIPFDYDGDGKTDLCHIHSSGMDIYTFTKNGNTLTAQNVASNTTLNRSQLANRFFSIGDFNGDGLMDFVLSDAKATYGSQLWFFIVSKGDGTFDSYYTNQGPNTQNTTSDYVVQDINSDGISDLVELTDNNFTSYLIKNYEMTQGTTQTLNKSGETLVPVSLYSSSLNTQFVSLRDTSVTLYSYKTNQRIDQALTGMANSYGVVEKNYYYTIKRDNLNIYTNGTGAVFPYSNIFEAVTVIAGNEIFKSGSSLDNNKYYYNSAVLHKQGLGFRGFLSVEARNKKNQPTTTTYNPYNHSVLEEIDGPTSKVTYTNSTTVDSYKRLKALVTSKEETDYLRNVIGTTNYTYDTYGQILTESLSLPGNITVNKAYTYFNSTDISTKYHLGKLATATTTTTRGNSQHSEQTQVANYNTYDQPGTIYNRINGNLVNTTIMVYDTSGNMTRKEIKPYTSSTPRIFTYQYTSGNRKTMETPPVGIWKSYSYNTDGTISSMGSAVGTTNYTYDDFGRVISESRPDTTVINTSFSWNSNNGGLYAITKSGTNIPTETTIYDALNREVRHVQTRFDGSLLKVDKSYDTYGNLSQESYPYKSGSPTFKEYTYDYYNRLTGASEAGKITSYSYNDLNTTVSDGTMSTTTTEDALGGVVSVTDPAGTITYTLNGAGNPTSISAPGGTNGIGTTIGYDGYGRRTSIADPSHGTTTYSYHSSEGYLQSETNAKNQTTSYVYDIYGRMTQKTCQEFYTTYTYDNSLNKITAETSSNGTSTSYSYDALGRLSSTRENAVDSKWLQRDYTYSNGKVSTIKYTSQSGVLTTENYYYTNGHLSSVKLNGTTNLYSITSENNQGRVAYLASSGISRYYGYTIDGLPTSRAVTVFGPTKQSIQYSFNAQTGNLETRAFPLVNKTEDFTYDNLHRLTGFGNNNVVYDNKGNISSKDDVGSFAYNISGKPYAVSDVTLNNSISVGTQNVSYYSFDRPNEISDNGYTATFTYNGNYDRIKMAMLHNSSTSLTRYYLGGCYELDVKPSGTTEKLYLSGGYYDAPSVLIKQGNTSNVYHILRDHLGSITHVLNSSGTVMQELSYDAWGRLRNPSTFSLYTPTYEPEPYLGRGYCGHEHLTGLSLINMNARLYDPLLGRFLSPDPYVQAPEHSQSFNRYSYCLNNPLKYTDENGKFFLISWISGFVKGTTELISGRGNWYSPFYRAYKNTVNDIKIDLGLFKGDFKQIASRFTWESLQTIVGLEYSKWNLVFHDVDKIRYYDGATYVINKTGKTSGTTGSTLGSFINITTNEPIPMDNGKFAPYAHPVYAHEYGHYLQSQSTGPAYLFKYGIPSVIDFYKNKDKKATYLDRNGQVLNIGKHHIHNAEIDANKRAAQYFSKKGVLTYNSQGWDYELSNPTFAIVL